jgi:hypothetical protein
VEYNQLLLVHVVLWPPALLQSEYSLVSVREEYQYWRREMAWVQQTLAAMTFAQAPLIEEDMQALTVAVAL